jgi:hypothetical protein
MSSKNPGLKRGTFLQQAALVSGGLMVPQIIDAEKANAMLTRPMRAPWAL